MTQKKIKYEVEFISFAEAAKKFISEENFLLALKEGRVIAYGEYFDALDDETSGPRIPISSYDWRSFEYKDGILSGGVNPTGQEDTRGYTNIEIELSSISHEKKIGAKRGRPIEHDWDSFWRAVAYHLYMTAANGDVRWSDWEKPNSIRDWARNIHSLYHFIWETDNIPSTTMLKEKLRPLFHAIDEESPEAIEAAAKKNRR